MKKWILLVMIILGIYSPIWIISKFTPLSSPEYEDPEMNVGWVVGVGFIVSIILWFLLSILARSKNIKISLYFLSWSIITFMAAGYYSFTNDEYIAFSILLSRAASVLLTIAFSLFLFEQIFPSKIEKIGKWINETMKD